MEDGVRGQGPSHPMWRSQVRPPRLSFCLVPHTARYRGGSLGGVADIEGAGRSRA